MSLGRIHPASKWLVVSGNGVPMCLNIKFEETVASLSDTNQVSRECAIAYMELEEWERTQKLTFCAVGNAIEELAHLFGWTVEEAAKGSAWTLRADDILDLCDLLASLPRKVRRSKVLQELFSDTAVGNLTVMAFATLVDACGPAVAVNMVKALVKQRLAT